MHIRKLLAQFPPRINIEIVLAPLPESLQLLITVPLFITPHLPRHSLLKHLHNRRWRHYSRLANQKMHMFGHDHIAH